jgi:hypothetical protein
MKNPKKVESEESVEDLEKEMDDNLEEDSKNDKSKNNDFKNNNSQEDLIKQVSQLIDPLEGE